MKMLVTGFCFGLFVSCAAIIIPKLENRSLFIHSSGRLFYPYCAKKNWFGNCKDWKEDFYDLTDPVVRAQLRGFVCKRRSRPY